MDQLMHRIKMEDVARTAGVSAMTVSRALKDDGVVAARTRQRILKAVKDLGYVPNQIASSLSSRRSGFVALLVPSLNNPPLAETAHALAQALEAAGLQLLIGYTNYETEREERLLAELLQRQPEAIVLVDDGHSKRSRELLLKSRIPVIHIWDWPKRPIGHVVGFSNEAVTEKIVRYLAERGYRRLAYLGETNDSGTRGARRRQGFVNTIKKLRLGPIRVYNHKPPPFTMLEGRVALPLMLQRWPDLDAIVCVSDPCAFGVLTEAQARGLGVPSELAIVGFGNFEVSRCCAPALTTVAVDGARLGRETASLLMNVLNRAPSIATTRSLRVKIDAPLTPRGTTC
jgi:LacI family transcriptional regulator, gluconate utilization system Gnt-I transcriptional repressor